MRAVLERLVDVLVRSGHRPVAAVPVAAPADAMAMWSAWLDALEACRDGAPLWLLPGARLVWRGEAQGHLRALRMGPDAARWMSDADMPLCGEPDEGCLMVSGKGVPELGAAPGAVLDVQPGAAPRVRAPTLSTWVEQVARMYADAQLEVDADGWVAPRLPAAGDVGP